jgi:acetyl esterase/lipase
VAEQGSLSPCERRTARAQPVAAVASAAAAAQAPKDRSGPCPVIVFPHGGPHTAVAANYYMPFAFLTRLGYCVVAVNYR